MRPVNSNIKSTCVPVSSNCVIWEGVDLPGIELCATDSISDVVQKINTLVQSLQGTLNLTDLDLSCLVEACELCPEPSKTLSSILTLLISKVCSLEDLIVDPGTPYVEPTITLATCIQYINDEDVLVTQLPLSDYTRKIGTKVCEILTSLNAQIDRIDDHENRISTLENADPDTYTPPTVTPSCVLPATPVQIETLLTALEEQFCELKQATGEASDIVLAVAKQCSGLNQQPALSQSGTMGAIAGWETTATTAADAINNLWLTICDLRAAVIDLKDCCGQTDCSAFILAFSAAASENREIVTLFLSGSTVIPSGFDNCNLQGSKVTIRDSAGNTHISYIDLVAAAADVDGIAIDISSSSINTSLAYTVTIEGCLSKNGNVCSKTAVENISVPCPVVTGVSATLA